MAMTLNSRARANMNPHIFVLSKNNGVQDIFMLTLRSYCNDKIVSLKEKELVERERQRELK